MNERMQVQGDPSPIVAPTPEELPPGGGGPSLETDQQHPRDPAEGADLETGDEDPEASEPADGNQLD